MSVSTFHVISSGYTFSGKKSLHYYAIVSRCYVQIICQNVQKRRHLLLSLPAHFIAKIPRSVESRFIPRARL